MAQTYRGEVNYFNDHDRLTVRLHSPDVAVCRGKDIHNIGCSECLCIGCSVEGAQLITVARGSCFEDVFQ